MVTRIGGLASGMDTDQVVKDLMKTQRTAYNRLIQKKTQLEWKKTDYNTLYNTIKDYRLDLFNSRMTNNLMPNKATSGNEAVLTATADADAVTFTHTIEVRSLAQGASMSSTANLSALPVDRTNLATHIGVNGAIKLTISDGTTTADLVNAAGGGTAYDTTGKTIYDLVGDINKMGLNVKASYDFTLDRFFLSSTKPGEANQITLSSIDSTGTGAGSLAAKLQLGAAAILDSEDGSANFVAGKDADIRLDGVDIKQASNSFTISGVTYNLKTALLGQQIQVGVARDVAATITNVKTFIDNYNKMIDKINGELNEKHERSYLPLTSDQKSEMKDADIATWEEKAKSGMLSRDSILQNIVYQMRSDISRPITGLTGSYTTAASIGITTGHYSEQGKLHLDETKLRAALEADPEVLSKVLGTDGADADKDGLIMRLYDSLKTGMDKVKTQAGTVAGTSGDTQSNLARRIREYDDRMATMERRLQTMEDRYYKQFTAMETALQKMNSQSAWLSSQLSSG
jgi:flagellar hook-associated protein 2